jgi:beta-N-acetylhexosaminidase
MTVEERVGQLFLVAFAGNDLTPGSEIAQLIRQDHIGGIVLLASNANFYNRADAPRQVADLTNNLQTLAMTGDGARIPLFVAVDHEGDGYPFTQITGGTTPLPNAMAMGATWDPDNARAVGQVTGLELAAMGINLLLGPSLDVLHTPRPSGQADIGTRSFGGDPWWVSQMGRAYIQGVHQGSGGRVATVAKHFPGHGGSDRPPDQEVVTIDKSIDQLRQLELAPFMAITGDTSNDGVTDALMSAPIRYQSQQGDTQPFTGPLAFDPGAMDALLSLEEFVDWRRTGLMVSTSLGLPAVHKYFDPTLSTFPHRRMAKEAFLAGNDLLLLSRFDLEGDWATQFANIRDTISFFRTEYESNPAFATQVDESVARILWRKLKLYPEPNLEAVQVHAGAALQVCGLGIEVTQRVANQALTLLYPDPSAIPVPPDQGEELLIFTDARPVRDCAAESCPPFPLLSHTAVEEAILRIYGPQGTGQIDPADITSLPFGQLQKYLTGEEVDYDVGALLDQADWILFAQQDINLDQATNSDTVKRYLNHSLTAASRQQSQIIVIAFNAPYYLDTTDISKLSLYLGAYSKSIPFIEASVRALFAELAPGGAAPVDVQGINYDLQRQLAPDPDQLLPLALIEPSSGMAPLPPVTARLQAGPILDRNGHIVPDGVEVTFYAEYESGAYAPPHLGLTANGQARAAITLTDPGQIRFRAESEGARRSQEPVLTIQPQPTTTLTPTPTPTTGPTATPTRTPEPTAAPPATPIPGPSPATAMTTRPVDGGDLLLAAGATLLVAVGGLFVLRRQRRQRSAALRWILAAITGGMFAYILFALAVIRPETWGGLPSGAWISRLMVTALAVVGAMLPLAILIRKSGRQR